MADSAAYLARGFVQIQNGCDHRCTFCVIPFGRGASRSSPAAQIVARIETLVARGVPEIVLTGVDITAWGLDLPGMPTLGRLVCTILRDVPGLARLRLGSIDAAETDDELLAAFAEEPRLQPHVHLSLQSGADLILKRMRRRHSRADAVAFCAELRRRRPDIAIGADLIAGFPTESEHHFADTLSLVDACGLTMLHVFPYSVRPGTPAARMPQVPATAIAARAARLRQKGEAALVAVLDRHLTRPLSVAIERAHGPAPTARTPQFVPVRLTGLAAGHAPGQEIDVVVTSHNGRQLLAEVRA